MERRSFLKLLAGAAAAIVTGAKASAKTTDSHSGKVVVAGIDQNGNKISEVMDMEIGTYEGFRFIESPPPMYPKPREADKKYYERFRKPRPKVFI